VSDRKRGWEVAVVLLLLVGGGVLGLVATSWVWGHALIDEGVSKSTLDVTGWELLPLGRAIAVLALASAIALFATRWRGRFLIGSVLAFAGLAQAVYSFNLARELSTRVMVWATEAGFVAVGAEADPSRPMWNAAAGLLISAAGVLVAIRGQAWPGLSRRFQRAGTAPARDERPTSQQSWDALDRGEDPTIGP
jgi:uncharacterized membrane protein (TIGR02234 family)